MRRRRTVLGLAALALATLTVPAEARTLPGQVPGVSPPQGRQAVAVGYGGAVSSVDVDATQAGIEVLRRGGNAVDAAVAATATLGVTEPYVAAIGGGGFFTYYDARTHKVSTIDGRETGPARMTENTFIDPKTGKPLPFDEAVTSGLSVGVPGTLATWDKALRAFGTRRLGTVLQPAIRVAEHGFTVDQEFYDQTALNADRFKDIVPTRELFLPGGKPPAVGSTFRNPDLAGTYRQIARRGLGWFYGGALGAEIARTVRTPPVDPKATRNVRPGVMRTSDLADYHALNRAPTHVNYRGLDVYGMAPPSSGGSTVGEALNIMKNVRFGDPVQALHTYLEASRLAYADRNAYVGDPAYVDVPLKTLLSDGFARSRACLIKPDEAAKSPVPPGDLESHGCAAPQGKAQDLPYEGPQTTHLVTADRWGNVVSYTLTIEQFGGSAITVPHRGFLLNNEMTDFDFTSSTPAGYPDPNLPAAGKRPRSSMAPTIVLRNGRPYLAVGSPGGSTIITTVLQILMNRVDLGMTLPQAVAAPRATQRNTPQTFAEQEFIDRYGAALKAKGHDLALFPGPPAGVIGAAAGLEFLGGGRLQAVAEPVRRHGGSAMVVSPRP
ncbi:gamma-glutamyltransferase [Actinoallomurus spadix]|uniref:Glutathione hydrolase proenzyme n=1 Tax=Actinoallomurus spadix TaxID=79912 RepID=A0ABN0X8F5_9ACTN|nr:gamma-glutamyltransferase [Actinoallomurus spadix]MCO5990992.1 gamma-glutamyltransferase [Actinoallomurus spadix]